MPWHAGRNGGTLVPEVKRTADSVAATRKLVQLNVELPPASPPATAEEFVHDAVAPETETIQATHDETPRNYHDAQRFFDPYKEAPVRNGVPPPHRSWAAGSLVCGGRCVARSLPPLLALPSPAGTLPGTRLSRMGADQRRADSSFFQKTGKLFATRRSTPSRRPVHAGRGAQTARQSSSSMPSPFADGNERHAVRDKWRGKGTGAQTSREALAERLAGRNRDWWLRKMGGGSLLDHARTDTESREQQRRAACQVRRPHAHPVQHVRGRFVVGAVSSKPW